MTDASQLEQITRYVHEHARPLDRARFQHALADAQAQNVVDELLHFQNEDGGFGHGLEADLRLPASSPICTWVGLQRLIEVDVGLETGIVQRALNYLQATYDVSAGRWLPVDRSVNDHPHAAWWHYDEEKGGTPIHESPWNPTAALTAFMWHYDASGPDSPAELTERAIAYLRQQADTKVEMHELAVLVQLAALAPQPYATDLQNLTLAAAEGVVQTDPAQWSSYDAQPLTFVQSPQHYLYSPLRVHVEANLGYWLETLNADGSWDLPYQWYRDDEVFQRLKPELTAVFTVQRAIQLRAFKRL